MGKKQYVYDYENQRKLSKEINTHDFKLIAEKTGYKKDTIAKMCKGRRKMPDDVKLLIEKLVALKSAMENKL